jgi:hypothetical protein
VWTSNAFEIIQKHITQNAVPILYYVVVKNDTDIVALDNFLSIKDIKIKFENTSFEICETNKICEKLSTLSTRLCQE